MKALIVQGGWQGHEPKPVSKIFEKSLKKEGVAVEVSDTLDALLDTTALRKLDLIVPMWTMGEISGEQWKSLDEAVRGGVGCGGVHGGMGDAFRSHLMYNWMVGGHFVGHPHVGDYEVRLTGEQSPITDGLPVSFPYNSEQYYMLTEPGNRVLADTVYEWDARRVVMPVVWTKTWGRGRIFYSSLGHVAREFKDYPHVLEMTIRGLLWAGEGKALAKKAARKEAAQKGARTRKRKARKRT